MGEKELADFQDQCLEDTLNDFDVSEKDAFISLLFMNIMLMEELPNLFKEALEPTVEAICDKHFKYLLSSEDVLRKIPKVNARFAFDSLCKNLSPRSAEALEDVFCFLACYKTRVLELENVLNNMEESNG